MSWLADTRIVRDRRRVVKLRGRFKCLLRVLRHNPALLRNHRPGRLSLSFEFTFKLVELNLRLFLDLPFLSLEFSLESFDLLRPLLVHLCLGFFDR